MSQSCPGIWEFWKIFHHASTLPLNHAREFMPGNFPGASIMPGNLGIPGHGCPGFYTKSHKSALPVPYCADSCGQRKRCLPLLVSARSGVSVFSANKCPSAVCTECADRLRPACDVCEPRWPPQMTQLFGGKYWGGSRSASGGKTQQQACISFGISF